MNVTIKIKHITVKPRYNHIRLNAISDLMHFFQINGWLHVLSMPKRLDTVHFRLSAMFDLLNLNFPIFGQKNL